MSTGQKDFALIAATILAAGLPFLLAPIRAQVLGPAGRGEFAYFQSSMSILFAVSALGVRHAVYRTKRSGPARFESSNRAVLTFALIASVLAGVVLVTLARNTMSPLVAVTVMVASLLGPVYALTQLEMANSQLGRYRKRIATLAGAPAVVEFACSLLLLFIKQFSVMTAIWATLLAEAVRNSAAIFWRLRDRKLARPSAVFRDKSGILLLRASLIAAPAVLVPILASNLDSIIYGSMLGASSLGMYVVAKIGFSVFVLMAITAEGFVVARLAHRKPIESLILLALVGTPVAAIASGLGLVLFPYFFGDAFEQARVAFPIAVSAGVMGAGFVSFLSIAAFNGRQRSAFLAAVVSLLALGLGAVAISLFVTPNASEMCLVLLGAQTLGVLQIALGMTPNSKGILNA